MENLYSCIDANSPYCPCYLASSQDCVYCSYLQGKDYCDCNWQGICILYEYFMNNMEVRQGRQFCKGIVEDKREIRENLFEIKILLGADIIENLDHIGAYVFINKYYKEDYFNTPMSVFNIDDKHIYLVYHEIGPKTIGINLGDEIGIKGPFFNGILGEKDLSKLTDTNILVAARSIGQSSIVLAIRKLRERNNQIYLFLDEGKCKSAYCLDLLKKEEIAIYKTNFFIDKGEREVVEFLKENKIDIVYSSGSDMLHRTIKGIINKADINVEWFVSNNNILCCGEGICGSCIRKTNGGDRIKTCKTIVDPMNLY